MRCTVSFKNIVPLRFIINSPKSLILIYLIKMKKIIYSVLAFTITLQITAQDGGELKPTIAKDPLEKTFITRSSQELDADFQYQLRRAESWKSFSRNFPQWQVSFDEGTQMPHRAAGPGIALPSMPNEIELLKYFSANYISAYNLPINELSLRSSTQNDKHVFYHFKQTHNGKEVLNSDLYLKLSKKNELIIFGLDVFKNIPNVEASIDIASAKTAAQRGVKGVTKVVASETVKILPVPAYQAYDFYPVYEVNVESMDEDNIPANYYTIVNANTGAILYRQNMVQHIHNHEPNHSTNPVNLTMPGKVSATYYKLNPVAGSSFGSLGYVRITAQGQTFYADSAGVFNLPFSDASLSATLSLNGLYSNTRINGGTAPTITSTLSQSQNNITFGAPALINHLTAYNAVNRIHDYMKVQFPLFTALDISMPTNIELTSGNCNAFYNGSSVNFFAPGNGCNSTANVADVVYHEYGHGINGTYYSANGGSFNNGGMNEGYADVWAIGLTENPVLGIGFFTSNTGFVRRYDVNKKVYPADLVGEVHADGEIIAGAWWDYGQEINNVQSMMGLFKSTYPALLTAPNGQEGKLYADILLEAVTEDDTDNNLTNGTPNFCSIIKAFGQHGIELYGSLNITSSSVTTTPASTLIAANITNTNLGPKIVKAFHSSNLTPGVYTQVTPTFANGQLSFSITPALPAGSIVKYYMTTQDTCSSSSLSNYFPLAANPSSTYPNLPFMDMIGYNLIEADNFDNSFNDWDFFGPNDNATTGIWDIDFPIGSFADPTGQTGMVQTNNDHTTASIFNGKCAITANALNATLGIGDSDVDGGKTTLTSKFYDLTGLTDPTFSYWRWYTNDQGATPKTDFWKVQISNDFVTWIDVENTLTPDHSWRKNIIRVSDYVTPNASVTLRFIADDANAGSLVEAAIDDVELYATNNPNTVEKLRLERSLSMYPNPTKDKVNVILKNDLKMSTIKVTDQLGREVKNISVNQLSQTSFNTGDLKKGIYFVSITTDKKVFEQKLIVQ
jgi:Zn-dependent metalloprotease